MFANTDFYIKVRYNTTGYNYPVPVEMINPGYADAHIESGKCWMSYNGTSWGALGFDQDVKADLCIKAYGELTTCTPPATPTIGLITQPNCAVKTGSVVLSGLPSTGTWTLTRNPDGATTTGSGTSKTISGLLEGTYTYTVNSASDCISDTSENIIIDTLPITKSPVSISATNNSGTSFSANWSASSDVTGYMLDVSTDNSFTVFLSGFNNKDVGNVTSINVPGLNANTNYYYRIRAYNLCGTSINSGTIIATTLPNAPSAPVVNVPIGIIQTSYTANWSSVATATGYRLDVATDYAFTSFVPGYNNTDIGNITSTGVTGLSANTSYYYRVIAYNTGGNSPNSNIISLTTLPNPPVSPATISATNAVQTSFIAQWGSSNTATGYRLDIATDSGFTSIVSGYNDKDVGNALAINVSGLTAKTTYYYRVRAYNTGGTSNSSGSISVTTLTNPASVPLELKSSSCNDMITLSWRKTTGPDVIRYLIYGGLTTNPMTIMDSTTNSASDTLKNISGLIRGQLYYFRITAVNYDGPESAYGSQVSETVKKGVVPFVKSKWGDLLICPNIGDSIISFQWFKSGVAISNAKTQNFVTNKQPGLYTVQTMDKNGCINISNGVTITGTKSLSVFPNPTSESFALKISDVTEGRIAVSIINSEGIIVKEIPAENMSDDLFKQISVSKLIPGIYIVKILVDNKGLYYTKIVVTK